MLTALGFGPETVLMNDPKLFMDGRFLASLLVELDDELGAQDSALALFQIGLLHGMRDAARMCESVDTDESISSGATGSPDTPALVMCWALGIERDDGDRFSLHGHWPECHEAVARCSRLGPTDAPTCWMSAGYTTGWLSSTLERPLIAHETECAAQGAEACRFEVYESPEWQRRECPEMSWLIENVAFDAFRKVAAAPPIERSAFPPIDVPDRPSGTGQFDRSQAVVHIWGPVMVLPFTTLDEALGTIDMLSRDPGIAEIRSVVVDLRERPLDEGFGAAALEQVLETIESWNAQSLITGVSPAAEAAIASLESSHLVLRKDLAEAIATAFQIADAQRHLI